MRLMKSRLGISHCFGAGAQLFKMIYIYFVVVIYDEQVFESAGARAAQLAV